LSTAPLQHPRDGGVSPSSPSTRPSLRRVSHAVQRAHLDKYCRWRRSNHVGGHHATLHTRCCMQLLPHLSLVPTCWGGMPAIPLPTPSSVRPPSAAVSPADPSNHHSCR